MCFQGRRWKTLRKTWLPLAFSLGRRWFMISNKIIYNFIIDFASSKEMLERCPRLPQCLPASSLETRAILLAVVRFWKFYEDVSNIKPSTIDFQHAIKRHWDARSKAKFSRAKQRHGNKLKPAWHALRGTCPPSSFDSTRDLALGVRNCKANRYSCWKKFGK